MSFFDEDDEPRTRVRPGDELRRRGGARPTAARCSSAGRSWRRRPRHPYPARVLRQRLPGLGQVERAARLQPRGRRPSSGSPTRRSAARSSSSCATRAASRPRTSRRRSTATAARPSSSSCRPSGSTCRTRWPAARAPSSSTLEQRRDGLAADRHAGPHRAERRRGRRPRRRSSEITGRDAAVPRLRRPLRARTLPVHQGRSSPRPRWAARRSSAREFLPGVEWLARRPWPTRSAAAVDRRRRPAASRRPGLHGTGLDSAQRRRPHPAARRAEPHPGHRARVRRRRSPTRARTTRRTSRSCCASRAPASRSASSAPGRLGAPGRDGEATLALPEAPPLDQPVTIRRRGQPGARRGEDRQQLLRVRGRLHRAVGARGGRYPRRRGAAHRPAGLVALARRGAGARRADARRRAGRAVRRLRAEQRVVLGAAAGRPRRPRRRPAAGVRRAARPRRGGRRRGSRTAWPTRSTASTARSPTARSSATTPTASCRATSPPRWRCSTPRGNGVVLSSHHPPRDGADVLQAGDRRRAASTCSRRRRTRPSGWRSPANAARRARGLMRARRTSGRRARTRTRRWPAPPGRWEPVPLPTWPTSCARPGRRAAARARPDRELARGRVGATLDALVFETPDVVIVGELVHPVTYCLIAASRSRWTRSAPSTPIRRRRPVRALHPRAPAGRGRGRARVHRRRRPRRRPRRRARRRAAAAAIGSRPRRSSTAPSCSPGDRGRRGERHALRLARAAGGGAAARARRCRPAAAADQDRAGLLGRRRPRAGLARARAWPSSPSAASTSPGSSRGRAGSASATTCSSATSRGTRTTRRSPRRSRACAGTARPSGCSAPSRPPYGADSGTTRAAV